MGDRIKGAVFGLLFALTLGFAGYAGSQSETVLGELKRLSRIWDGTDVWLIDASGNGMVGDGSGPLTVDGTVTANQGSPPWQVQSNSANIATETTLGTRVADATITGRLPAGATPADNESNAITTTVLRAYSFLFDGTAWDRAPGNSTDGALVNLGANNDVTVTGGVDVSDSFLLDATYTGRMPAGASPADAESNTNTALSRIGTFLFGFDGTDWNRVRLDSTTFRLETEIEGGAGAPVTSFPDNEPFNEAQRGGTAVVAGACERESVLYVQIDQTAGEQLITGTASERIYICSFQIISATAQNVALVDGTGTVCATSPTGLLGGSTAATGWNLAANGGLVLPPTRDSYTKTSTDADNVCLLQSASGQISGSLTYISIPNI